VTSKHYIDFDNLYAKEYLNFSVVPRYKGYIGISVFLKWKDFMEFFLCVVGMVMIVEGLPYFAFPEKMKLVVKKFLEMPAGSMRKFGFVLMIFGLFLIFMGKR